MVLYLVLDLADLSDDDDHESPRRPWRRSAHAEALA